MLTDNRRYEFVLKFLAIVKKFYFVLNIHLNLMTMFEPKAKMLQV